MPDKQADIKTLEKLAEQMESDGRSGRGLNPSAVFSIVDIIRRAVGAPLMWPSREAGAEYAERYYQGDNAARAAFNHGVKWAVENYRPQLSQ